MKIKSIKQIKELITPDLKRMIRSVEIGETNDDGSLVVITWLKLPYYNLGSMSGYIHSESVGEWKRNMKNNRRIKCKEDLKKKNLDMCTDNYEETSNVNPYIYCDDDRFWDIIKKFVEQENKYYEQKEGNK